ncbi:MAG: hypothetical protein ACJ72G_11605 [Friedmanniella sp.]
MDLTRVRQDVTQLTDRAVAQAPARIAAASTRSAVVVPPRLVVRGTSGPAPSR